MRNHKMENQKTNERMTKHTFQKLPKFIEKDNSANDNFEGNQENQIEHKGTNINHRIPKVTQKREN